MMFIWESEEDRMGIVIEKLPHPYKLTHKKLQVKMEESFFFFKYIFSPNDFSLFLHIYIYIYIFTKNGGYL